MKKKPKKKTPLQIAEEVYDDEDGPRPGAFEHAWACWPDFNDGGEDTDNAQDYITEELVEEVDKRYPKLIEKQQEKVRDWISEMVYAGLT